MATEILCVIEFRKRLGAPWVDDITRVTYYVGADLLGGRSSTHEVLWSTPQARIRTPTFAFAPIYTQLAHEMRCWPIELPSCYDEIGNYAFWRYEEYVGRHRRQREERS